MCREVYFFTWGSVYGWEGERIFGDGQRVDQFFSVDERRRGGGKICVRGMIFQGGQNQNLFPVDKGGSVCFLFTQRGDQKKWRLAVTNRQRPPIKNDNYLKRHTIVKLDLIKV